MEFVMELLYSFKRMNIYTKTGDQGRTSLLDGSRVSKSHVRLHAYGTLDELNATLGLLCAVLEEKKSSLFSEVLEDLRKIQNWLFHMGSQLANPRDSRSNKSTEDVSQTQKLRIHWLEDKIDELSKELPPLKNFILPGGTVTAAYLHICRTITRRSERYVAEISLSSNEILIFLNRLSDYFFVLSRWCNLKENGEEQVWDQNL